MNNVNITEKYTLCLLKEKKILNNRYVTPYLIVSMMVRMMLDGNLEITDKNEITLNDKIPTVSYDKKLYEILKDMKKDKLSLRYVLTSICQDFSTKNIKDTEIAKKVEVAQKVISNMSAIITSSMITATSQV